MGELLADKLIDEFGVIAELVDTVEISHVQGSTFTGLTNSGTSNIVVLPLMRGGEPMARGVYSRFPLSLFIHFYDDEDDLHQRNGLLTKAFEHMDPSKPVKIIIADSVVNSGSSIRRAISYIRKVAHEINPGLQIALFVLSGVMQEGAAEILPRQFPRVRFITVRVSSNQYTGRGAIDTGNRLFGTTSVKD